MKLLFTLLLTTFLSTHASSATNAQTSSTKEPSKELRNKMAQIHEKMATCLKSDKSIKECQQQMHSNCQSMMGKSGCPMMGRMMGDMSHMMRRGQMMGE